MGKYEEALERAKAGKSLDEIFPELKESEDERIRKELIELVRELSEEPGRGGLTVRKTKMYISYLEKQKEQKPSTPEDIAAAYQMGLAAGRKEQEPLSTEETELNSIAFLEQLGYACVPPKAEQLPAELDNKKIEMSDFESELFSAFSDGWQQYLHGEEVDVAQWAKEHSAQLLNAAKQELKPAEWSDDFEENIRTLLHNKLTWHNEDGSMSSTVFIDDKTLKDIVSGIWFYVGKEALKYPNKEIHVQEWSEEFLRLMGITISQDGNQVCVLLGENLAEGIAGFGDTLADAVEEFKKEWRQFDRFRKATWKPSEEQIEVFFKANPVNLMPDELAVYHSLYNDLKKL